MSDRDPDGWFTNPIDESVMGPAQALALARAKVEQYRAYQQRDHMNRVVTGRGDRIARRRSIAMRVLASAPWLFRS